MLITKKGIKILATKAKLKAEQGKIENLQTHNLSYFLSKTFFCNDGFQNMFLDQPLFSILKLRQRHLLC